MTVAGPVDFGKARLQVPEFTVEDRVDEVAEIIADPRRGRVTELAQRHHISRQSASLLVNRGRQALRASFAPKAAGRPARTHALVVDKQRIQTAVVSLALDAHASNAGTQACLETMFDHHLSTGAISGILKDAAGRAQRVLDRLPMPATPQHLVADEIYDHDQPILTVLDDETLAMFLMAREPSVDGTTWGVHLLDLMDRGLDCSGITTDQGAAMRAGIAESGFVPTGNHGTDVFHVLRDLGRGVRGLQKQAGHAEAHLVDVTAALDRLTRPRRGPGRPRKVTASLEAYEQADAAAAAARQRADAAQFLYREVRTALSPIDGVGRLITEASARATLQTAAELFRSLGPQTLPLAGLLDGAQAQVHVFRTQFEQTYHELAQRHGTEIVEFVGWVWYHRHTLGVQLPATEQLLRADWGLQAPLAAVAEIWHSLRNSHRSSSMNEGFNSHLRTDIQVHRGLTQSLQTLIAFRHNVHAFRRGVHRGQAPFVALGILPESPLPWARQLFLLSASQPGATSPLLPTLPAASSELPESATADQIVAA